MTDESSIPDFEPFFKDKLQIHEDERKKAIKMYIADKLKKYQDAEVGTKDFRIFQGVLSTSFGSQELGITEVKNMKERKKADLLKEILKAVKEMASQSSTGSA